ncbi:MAG: iron-sulfur cluster assembly accessory protein [Rickettsiaceae bacterium]|nr:iron-sulfur cluster assembly accessory protein [Rickettsiaceae bacterium]
MTVNIIVSESAAQRIIELAKKEKDEVKGLRISVEAGGCSGLQYKYELTNIKKENDIVIRQSGAQIFVDPVSAKFLNNSDINFVENLGGAYFEIKNPNASLRCGCGNSFAAQKQ